MIDSFLRYITQKDLIRLHESVIVAVSGGVDSVVLAHLMKKSGFRIAIAHCNFQLRGSESEGDEEFVRSLAVELKAPVFVTRFDTKKYAEAEKISIQMAARELRYRWFEQLRVKENYDYIAVAHHQTDSVETVLLNLVRGTGIAGMHGINPKVKNIIRPLLFAGRGDLLNYAKENSISWREDSSNQSVKYARNLIRHKVVPLLNGINPDFEHTMQQTIEKISAVENIFKSRLEEIQKEVLEVKNGIVRLNLHNLSKEPEPVMFLFGLIERYGFSWIDAKNIYSASGTSGKVFLTSTHRLSTGRNELHIEDLGQKVHNRIFVTVQEPGQTVPLENKIFMSEVLQEWEVESGSHLCFADLDKLSFPLVLRNWVHGDRFRPLGMKGSKKISDFLINQKVNLADKDKVLVLTSGEDIVWVVGYRMDDRFKITDKTRKVLKVSIGAR